MFTIKGTHNGKRLLCNVVLLAPPAGVTLIDHTAPNATPLAYRALIDTGATSSGITPKVVEELGLAPVGSRPITHAGGADEFYAYYFKLGFLKDANDPGIMEVYDAPVEGFRLPENNRLFEVIIGMDVISRGRLVIDNNKFQLSLPSS